MGGNEKLPIFSGNDFPVWKMIVEQYLASKGMKKYLTTRADPKVAGELQEETIALSYITRSLDFKQARLVLCCQDPASAWAKLCQVHELSSAASKIGLQRQFFALSMEKDEKIADYVSRVEYSRSQLGDAGSPIAEETVVAKIVSGLPPWYKSFCTNWASSTPAQQKINILLGRLLEEEALLAAYRRPPKESVALNADGSAKDNKTTGKAAGRAKSKNKNCFRCGKEGHWKAQCTESEENLPSTSKKEQDKEEKKEATAVIAETNISEATSAGWIIDTGATEHMSYDRSSFSSYKELKPFKPVRVGNSAIIRAIGVGDVRVTSQLLSGRSKELILKDVLHVPRLTRKLLSVSATTDQGHSGTVGRDKFVITSAEGDTLIVAERHGQLFKANIKELAEESERSDCSEADVAENDELGSWHERFGHVHKRRLVKMAKSKAVEGLDAIANASVPSSHETARCSIDCEHCLTGKQSRLHFAYSSKPKASEVGDKVHVDICGPIDPQTVGGNSYFVLFKDEFSSYRYVYFIKSRGEAHDSVRKCVAAFQGELKAPVKTLVSDRGSEFTSNKTQEFLMEKAIHHQVSTPFTPAQNGFIERENRTVVESARSMLSARRMPHKLWGEAVRTAVYLLNRSTNVKSDVTPY